MLYNEACAQKAKGSDAWGNTGKKHTVETEQVVVFFTASSVFSNHFRAPIIDPSGIVYPTLEHYLMHQKAKLFGDQECARAIMLALYPLDARNVARGVKRFERRAPNLYARVWS